MEESDLSYRKEREVQRLKNVVREYEREEEKRRVELKRKSDIRECEQRIKREAKLRVRAEEAE